MTDLVFDKDEIASLCAKISEHYSEFTPREANLLLAIFAVAANHAEPHGTRGLEGTLPQSIADVQPVGPAASAQDKIDNFKQQLLNSYIPGESFKSIAPAGDDPGDPGKGGRIGGRLIPRRGDG